MGSVSAIASPTNTQSKKEKSSSPNTNKKKDEISSPAQSESVESNEPEYDLESFGIKETASSYAPTPNPKSSKNEESSSKDAENEKKLAFVQASLPSISAFEKANKRQPEVDESNDGKPVVLSNITSIASTPRSNKSVVISQRNLSGLKKLKEKIKSAKKEKVTKSVDNSKFKTPATKNQISLIQTPRHSLKKSATHSKTS